MKVGDLVKYKENWKETIGIVIDVKSGIPSPFPPG